jgi:predicted dehydrogenase
MARRKLTRRRFVAGTGQAALGAMIVPRHVLGRGFQAPSDTLNIAMVGTGGMGMNNATALVSENIVAVCDVDFGYVDRSLADHLKQKDKNGNTPPDVARLGQQYARAKRYADFREMLDKQKDIEAVVIATPDVAHAIIAKTAMLAGKHVYVQKPLTHSVWECRVLARTAADTGVVTQMGNQGHSSNDARLINEWVQAGLIGDVREVHVWTNRPIWPQAIPAPGQQALWDPNDTPPAGVPHGWDEGTINRVISTGLASNAEPAQSTLHWDLYTGPAEHPVDYHPIYHPFNWRGWLAFGNGALGDMGAHLIDHPYWALDLGLPTSIEATSTPWGGPRRDPVSYPWSMTVHYEFAARGAQPPVRMSWYDGGLYPQRPASLPDSVALNGEGGAIFVGERGLLMHETYGQHPRLFPEELMQQTASVPQTYPRITVSHEMNWAMACKGQGEADSPISYAARLTETMLLGIVALRAGQGKKILYDADAMAVTNAPLANPYLKPGYQPGWEV